MLSIRLKSFSEIKNLPWSKIYLIFLYLFCMSIVFDPVNQLFHIKYLTFAIIMISYLMNCYIKPKYISANLVFWYLFIMLLIIPFYAALNNYIVPIVCDEPDIIGFWKPYFFLLFVLPLIYDSMDKFERYFIINLALLSLVIILLSFFASLNDVLFFAIYKYGYVKQIFAYSDRQYGFLAVKGIYYTTSPLLFISLSYWSFKILDRVSLFRICVILITMVSLILSGTRNNMLGALLVPFFIFLFYGKSIRVKFIFLLIIIIGITLLSPVLMDMFSNSDKSNSQKLNYLFYYDKLFDNSYILFFGQGLGSYFYTGASGRAGGCSNITELTYVELIRVYGVFVALIIMFLILHPIIKVLRVKHKNQYIAIGFSFYLFACASNPFLFSSNGMVVFCLLLATVYNNGIVLNKNE